MSRFGIVLAALFAVCAPASARSINGIDFPERVQAQQALVLSGLGVVERRFLPFYAVGLYVRPTPTRPEALAAALEPCRIVVHWLTPTLAAADAKTYWLESVTRGADPDEVARLQSSLERVFAAFGGAARGDKLELDYDPDVGLRVTRNDQPVGHFAGLQLNRLILGMWLGGAADPALRQALLTAPAAQAAAASTR